MCCLGFCSKAFGATDKQIVEKDMPYSIGENWKKNNLPEWLNDSLAVDLLSDINDNINSSDDYKVKKIYAIFAEHGIKVKFIH